MNTYSSIFIEEKSSNFVRECRIRLFTEWFVKSFHGIFGTDILNQLSDHSYFTIILEILVIYRPNEDGVDEGFELLIMESENEKFQKRWFFSRSEHTHRRIS